MAKKKTHEQYVEELKNINPNIEVLEQYNGAKIKILHKCLLHNFKWLATPDNIIQGGVCFECAKEKHNKAFRITNDEYLSKVKEINSNIDVIGTYVNARTPILHKCKKDNYEWMTTPERILIGNSCPKCAGNLKKTHKEYVCEVKNINSNIEVIEQYINAKTPILHKCLIHNSEWKVRPNDILRGKGCPICGIKKSGKARFKSHTQYLEELKIKNKNIIAIENYNGIYNPILHKCLIDGCEWCAIPHNILHGNAGCPKCNKSKGENIICKWLKEHNIKYESQKRFYDCRDKYTLPFDFYLSDYNIAIEYDGIQHYKPIEYFGGQESFKYTQKHDKIKNEYCENNNIKLLRIPYYKNIEDELNNFLFI